MEHNLHQALADYYLQNPSVLLAHLYQPYSKLPSGYTGARRLLLKHFGFREVWQLEDKVIELIGQSTVEVNIPKPVLPLNVRIMDVLSEYFIVLPIVVVSAIVGLPFVAGQIPEAYVVFLCIVSTIAILFCVWHRMPTKNMGKTVERALDNAGAIFSALKDKACPIIKWVD